MQDHLIEITKSKITIFNIGNGVRTDKNGYLYGVKEDTQSPSGTEVPVASTWQIMENRGNHAVCNSWSGIGTRKIKRYKSTQLSVKYPTPSGSQDLETVQTVFFCLHVEFVKECGDHCL